MSIYSIDELDQVLELNDVPRMDPGAPCPIVLADDQRIVLTYWERDDPPYPPTSQPRGVIRFKLPHLHIFGSPNDEAIDGHRLSDRGLHPYGAFEVIQSSLVRRLERMNSVHPYHNPARFERLRHFIVVFHDSTFECVAEGFDAAKELVEGVGGEYDHALSVFKR